MTRAIQPTGLETLLGEEELIVSKTDLKGRITYANDVFIRMAKYSHTELMGAPHSIIRHPEMPRCVFKLLWDTLQSRQEVFAYVVNLAKDGSHYWVFAHVTPTFDEGGSVIGYHSNRRKPDPAQIERINDPAVVLQRLGTRRLLERRDERQAADFEELRGGEEHHLRREAIDRIHQHALLDDVIIETAVFGGNSSGQA